jgi:hypothetical protein
MHPRLFAPDVALFPLVFRATRQYALLMSEIATATLAKRPSYIDILRLDERVRALYKMLPENSTPAAIPPPASRTLHHYSPVAPD